tara:strand:- start:51 stop:791 length:741 start_codon:yes stop_codon:yes gene_type:complete
MINKNKQKDQFYTWLIKKHGETGLPSSYIKAISILSEKLNKEIFAITDVEYLQTLYKDLINNQKDPESIYYYEEAPSYGEKHWFSASIKKYLEFLNELNSISDNFIPLIPKETDKEAQIRKNAAITGKKAEIEFKKHAENDLGWIVEDKTKKTGFGYDFECRDAHDKKLYVEIKGCRKNISDIRMTETEWDVARDKGNQYLLYIVWNLDDKPKFKKHINPYKKFKGKENPYESRVINIRIKKKYID